MTGLYNWKTHAMIIPTLIFINAFGVLIFWCLLDFFGEPILYSIAKRIVESKQFQNWDKRRNK